MCVCVCVCVFFSVKNIITKDQGRGVLSEWSNNTSVVNTSFSTFLFIMKI